VAGAEVGLGGRLGAEVHPDEAAVRVVLPAPAAGLHRRAAQREPERALRVRALGQRQRAVQRVAQPDVGQPVARRVVVGGQPVDGEREVVGDPRADRTGVGGDLDAGAVPDDVVAQRAEQQGERAVEVVAVPAAVAAEDARRRVVRIDGRGPAELDLQRLVRDPLHVRLVQAAQPRGAGRLVVRDAQPGEVGGGVHRGSLP
jgi:hypothetical protein